MTKNFEQKQRQQFVRKNPLGHNGVTYICFFLLFCSPPCVAADGNITQSPPPPALDGNYGGNSNSSSMGMLLAILIAIFLFMGLFIIYIRQCSEPIIDNPNGVQGGASRRGSRGLDPAVIESFPTFPYSYVKDHKLGKGTLECAVCLTEFEDDDKIRLLPKCDHAFHPDCIDAWFCNRTTCPVCRTNFAPVQGETPATIVPVQDIETGDPNREIPTSEPGFEANEQGSIHRIDEEPLVVPEVINRISMQNRPGRSISGSMKLRFGGRFPRSHSTGHSLVRPGDVERFTLRLPEDVRKQIMNMSHLNRTTTVPLNRTRSMMVVFPMLGKGYWTAGEASSRGRRSMTTGEGSSRGRKSEGWVFSMTPPFFMRAASSSSGSAKMITESADTPLTLSNAPSRLPSGVSTKPDKTELSSSLPPI